MKGWAPEPWGKETPKVTEVPPSDTSQATPQECLTKKPRISPQPTSNVDHSVSKTTVLSSSFSHVEQLRITQLKKQMLHIHHTLATLFPEHPNFTARQGPSSEFISPPPAEMPRKKPPPSSDASTFPDTDVDMTPTEDPNTNSAKQAAVWVYPAIDDASRSPQFGDTYIWGDSMKERPHNTHVRFYFQNCRIRATDDAARVIM